MYSIFIHNWSKLETAQFFIDRIIYEVCYIYTVKHYGAIGVVYSYYGILFSNKVEQINHWCNSMDDSQELYAEWKMVCTREHTVWISQISSWANEARPTERERDDSLHTGKINLSRKKKFQRSDCLWSLRRDKGNFCGWWTCVMS